MKRNWTAIIRGYVLIGLLGIMAVLVATAYLRAARVRRGIERAHQLAARGRPGRALGHLDRVRAWAPMYPVLERERLLAEIRCHTQRLDVPRARMVAEAMLDVGVYDVSRDGLGSLLDAMPAELVNVTLLRGEVDADAAWDGYVALIQQLRRYGRDDLLPAIRTALGTRFPGGLLPPTVHRALRAGAAAPDAGVPAPPPPSSTVPPQTPNASASGAVALSGEPPSAATTGDGSSDPREATAPTAPPAPEPADTPRWAIIVRDEAPAYDLQGKLRERLDAGTVVTITDTRKSNAGRVALSRLVGTGESDTMAVYLRDLETYQVPLADVPADMRDLLVRRVQFQSAIAALREKLAAERVSAANPHSEAFESARKDYAAFIKRAKKARNEMNAATGAERMKYADILRTMKEEEVPIKAAYEKAKQASDAWMAENGDALPRIDSPELRQLEAKLAGIEKKLDTLR